MPLLEAAQAVPGDPAHPGARRRARARRRGRCDADGRPPPSARRRAMQAGALAVLETPVTAESAGRGAGRDGLLPRPAGAPAAGGGGRRDRARRRSSSSSAPATRSRSWAPASAEEAVRRPRRGPLRLRWSSTSSCGGTSGFTLLERLKKRGRPAHPAGHRLHRQGPDPPRRPGCGATPRPSSSRTPAPRSGCSTRPRCSCTGSRPAAGVAAADDRAPARRRRGVRGQEGADRGRRRAQRLRADQRARAARHGGGLRRERPGGHRDARGRTRTSTSS